jgi:molybdopterin-guanine dinucleotide biosynthesis protein A
MGKPKALLEVRGQPILAYLLDRFEWPGTTMLVTSPGRERPPGAERFDREVVDPVADQGPLRGVLTALEACATELLVVTTVDMPGITREQLEWLATSKQGSALTMLRRRGRFEPFPLALPRIQVDAVRERIGRGDLSVQSLAREKDSQLMDAPAKWSDETWVNLNHPEEYDSWVQART